MIDKGNDAKIDNEVDIERKIIEGLVDQKEPTSQEESDRPRNQNFGVDLKYESSRQEESKDQDQKDQEDEQPDSQI